MRVLLSIAWFLLSVAMAEAVVERRVFGRTADGVEIEAFTLRNEAGAMAKVITFGAILADLQVPDRMGKAGSVIRETVFTPQNLERGFPQSGAVIGRFANRIAHGRFTLDGMEYRLATNAGGHHLHGGRRGFDKVLWTGSVVTDGDEPAVRFAYTSADGEEGYPGKLDVSVTYTLTANHVLRIDYEAKADRATPINFTNHAYFNLAGGGDVVAHELTLDADRFTVVDATLIPTGELKSVAGTALDFRAPRALGARADQLAPAKRYDHNFVLNRPRGAERELMRAARVVDPSSGRAMDVWTTEPGLQLYTSVLDGAQARPGFYCLETQHFPDSVNHPNFPSTILRPGETFRSTTEFRFAIVK